MTGAGTEPQLDGIMLDFDGTVLDTEATRLEAWRHGWAQAGMVLDAEEYIRLAHTPPGCSARLLARNLIKDECDATALGLIVSKISADSFRRASSLPVLPGVLELLNAARPAGIRTALVSGSARRWITHHLRRLALDRLFDVVVTADDVQIGKPDPAPYLLALRGIGLPSTRTIAVEDSAIGLSSAVGARVACAVVPNRVTAGLSFGRACAHYRSLEEVTIPMLREAAHQLNATAERQR